MENDITDIIKAEINEPPTTEELSKPAALTPFSFISSVSETKQDLFKQQEQAQSGYFDEKEIEKSYNPYIVNRGLSYFPDSVLFANEMNLHPDIPKKAQYRYFFLSLRKRKRISKWHKLDKDPELLSIQKYYNVRAEIAKEYKKLLSEEDIRDIESNLKTGDEKNK